MTPAPAYPLLVNDPLIEAIVDRIRAVLGRQPPYGADVLARILGVTSGDIRTLLEPGRVIDPELLIDVVSGLVRELALDPQWLLIGQYDSAVHRRALMIVDERREDSNRALRDFVRELFRTLRDRPPYLGFPPAPPEAV